jgi:UDP-N-acetylglucosamine diphosphorylase / glucose-1-phosphate thymidylyltransferase / UDP-N-acetylgalactosamine diphosphorylase / glucosamine-1-phosphate N-acetyltransferase / galactosamine-1-phosphate N-acetyltransferase
MRLILLDMSGDHRLSFSPLTLNRPLWELRCGITSLGEKLEAKAGTSDVAFFLPEYMAEVYRTKTGRPVNDPTSLAGGDLLIVDARVKADGLAVPGRSEVGVDGQGEVLYARITPADRKKVQGADIEAFLSSAKAVLPNVRCTWPTWGYTWDLIIASPHQIAADFAAAGRSGIEGTVEEPSAIRGSRKDIYVGPGATIHPMVVIDAEHGPVYIDEGVEVHPFTRIEGPCFIGKKSILLGAKCREGNSIGPYCRVGGEVEESIFHGYSNKYHDGFLGHSYVGEWVNLGALTTNSDLKNDYTNVSVMLDGKRSIDTGSPKVGALIGDHAKTSIGALFNTGSYVGAMTILMSTGKPLPKFIPSFGWFVEGVVTKGFGRKSLYGTAAMAMSRRKCQWTEADRAMWDAVFELTAGPRDEAVKRGRKAMMR